MVQILVADDANVLRVLACRSLEGYLTIEAANGIDALALAKERAT